MVEEVGSLRERTRRAVRAELVDIAVELFLAQGFDATTTEQIAVAAGLSRRSFFRYFSGKEDVLAHAMLAAGESAATDLAARPAQEPAWLALRRAFDDLVARMESDKHALAISRMILTSSAPHARHQFTNADWLEVLVAALQPRLATRSGAGEPRLQAVAITGAALACLHAAEAEWVTSDGQLSLSALLDRAMAAVHPLSEAAG